MKKIYKGLILKVIILISFLFMFSLLAENHKRVYAAPLTSEEMMQKEIEDLRSEKKELQEKYIVLDKEIYKFNLLTVLFLGGSGISIYKAYDIKKKIDKEVEKRVLEEVDKEVSKRVIIEVSEKVGEETNKIKSMIDVSDRDKRLMRETKILVISQNNHDEYKIKNLLKKFNETRFIKMKYALDNLEVLNEYNVILFNNISGCIDDHYMNDIIRINNSDKKVYFYFNKTHHLFNCEENQNINYATNNATLCSNLLDLIRYQQDIL